MEAQREEQLRASKLSSIASAAPHRRKRRGGVAQAPERHLFEGADAGNNTAGNALYSNLGQLIRQGRTRGLALCGRHVRKALERAAQTTRGRKT